jgi:tripartite ATP-independent transporter DctM subunit
MNPGMLTLLLFSTLLICVLSGLPIAFAIGGASMVFALLLWGESGLYVIASSISGAMTSLILIALPLFVFMANILERAGVADSLYTMMHHWMGPLRGGLAIGTVVICTVFAAMSGISATATVTMGLIALPEMLKRGYNKRMVIGSIMAGGALGQLIPPSVMMIVFAMLANTSVGGLFMGGIIPGLILSAMFSGYILIMCLLKRDYGPPLPVNERGNWGVKFSSLKAVILPIGIIIMVLGGIYAGICTPTEAAALGGFGAIIAAAIHRKLNWEMFSHASRRTLSVTAMVMWIIFSSMCFSTVYSGLGGSGFVENLLTAVPGGRYVPIIMMQAILFVLGCFLDPTGILMVCVPIFLPVVKSLGFSPIWFGVLFVMNMEMAFLTPPVGANLFYMKGVAPEGTSVIDIYRGALPFISLQAAGLILVMIWPQLVTWLPGQML